MTVAKLSKVKFVAASLLVTALIMGNQGEAQSRRYLLALSKGDHTLAIVDPATLKVLAKVPVGPDPHEVIASSDGKTAYVSNTYGGNLREINVIDLVGQKALPNIDTRPFLSPHGLAFAGGKLWFSAEGAKSVARYDPATQTIDWAMGTSQKRTHMIYVNPDEKHIYTTNVSSATVSIFEYTMPVRLPMPPMPGNKRPIPGNPPPGPGPGPSMEWRETVVPVGKGSEGFDISPTGKELWTAGAGDGTITIIDTAEKKVVATIDAKVFGANRLVFTPDGKRVLVSSLGNSDLFVFDVQARKEIKKINIGHGAAGLLVDPDGTRAFAACTPDNYLAVIDLHTLEVTSHIDVGAMPDGLAWAVGH